MELYLTTTPPPLSECLHVVDTKIFAFHNQFLGAFTKLLKATVSFVTSAVPHVTTRLQLDGFALNLI